MIGGKRQSVNFKFHSSVLNMKLVSNFQSNEDGLKLMKGPRADELDVATGWRLVMMWITQNCASTSDHSNSKEITLYCYKYEELLLDMKILWSTVILLHRTLSKSGMKFR